MITMKRKILIFVTMLISVILLSSVTAVPNIKVDRDMNNFISKITDKLISIVGFDIYDKTHNDIETLFYEQIEKTGIEVKMLTFYFDWLVDITVNLILLTMLFIGHGEISHSASVLLSAIIIFIPCFMITMLTAIPETLNILFDNLDSLENFLYEYGIIGIFLLILLIIPVSIILITLLYPIMLITSGLELWYSVIIKAYDRTMHYKELVQ